MPPADPSPPSPDPDSSPRRVRLTDLLASGVGIRSIALTVLTLLGVLYTLHFAAPVLLPVVLALLLSLLLAPLVNGLHRKLRFPLGLAAGVVLFGLVGTLGVAASFVVQPASAWIRTVPEKIPDIKYRLKLLQKPLEQVREATRQVEQLATSAPSAPSSNAPSIKMPEETVAGLLMSQTPAFLANLFVMFILLYFMLSSGDLFLRKVVRMVSSFEDKRRAVEIAREIEDRISRYLRTVTAINLALGFAVGGAVWLFGMENYVLWGVVAFVLNFIPYVGAFVGVLALLAVSLLTFESTTYALLPPAAYLLLNTIEGNFLTPIIVGRILTLNPVVIFVFLMFWGWIWGIVGALLAVPILATVKIVCDHLKPLAPIGEFIGGEIRDSP